MTGQTQRLLPALFIALMLHGILLSRQLGESRIMPAAKALQRITVSLGSRKVVKKSPVEKKQEPLSEEREKISQPVKPKFKEDSKPPPDLAVTIPPIHVRKSVRRKIILGKNTAKTIKPPTAAAPPAESMPIRQPAPSPAVQEEPGDPLASLAAVVLHRATPLYQMNPPPEYPRLARRRGLEGVVLLKVLVDSSGKVADIRVSRPSGHALLDQAAVKGVRRWRFTAGTVDGSRQEMWVEIPVRFQLR